MMCSATSFSSWRPKSICDSGRQLESEATRKFLKLENEATRNSFSSQARFPEAFRDLFGTALSMTMNRRDEKALETVITFI